jgi:hypothetical protein
MNGCPGPSHHQASMRRQSMSFQKASDTSPSLVTLDPLKRRGILYLRLLRSGPSGRMEVEQDLAARTGPEGARALDHLERLEGMMSRALDRPLDIGSLEAVRTTEDEAVVADLIASAVDQSPAERRLQASRIAGRGDVEPLARAAELAARALATGEVPKCSCGRTSAD